VTPRYKPAAEGDRSWSSTGWVSGSKAQKKSEEYTSELASAIADAVEISLSNA
ncbi:unnamed protein product, partial [Prorocentrum cordatum]